MNRAAPAVTLVIGLTLALVGCSSSNDIPPEAETSETPTSTPSYDCDANWNGMSDTEQEWFMNCDPSDYVTPSATPSPSETAWLTASVDPSAMSGMSYLDTTGSGYKIRTAVNVYEPKKLTGSESVSVAGASLSPSTCTFFDPAKDLVVPVTVARANETQGYDVDLSYDFKLGGNGQGTGVAVVKASQSGAVCRDGVSELVDFSANYTEPSAPGKVIVKPFLLILRNYFSPAMPGGNAAALDTIEIIGNVSALDSEITEVAPADKVSGWCARGFGHVDMTLSGATPGGDDPATPWSQFSDCQG